MTDAEKDAALTQLGSFQKSLKEGLGKDVLPLQLNKIKQFLGNRMNWGGTISVTDDIKPALRSVYGMMNKLIWMRFLKLRNVMKDCQTSMRHSLTSKR